MRIEYRGFEIEAKRERSLGGDVLLYYSIFRLSDGWEFETDFSTGSDSIRSMIGYLKEHVDDWYKNPQDYECSECGEDELHITYHADYTNVICLYCGAETIVADGIRKAVI